MKFAPPAWSYRTEHVPVPLVIVNVDPVFEQAPELENVTAPAGAVAATEKPEPKMADSGACVETLIVWAAFWALTTSTTCGAALKAALPAWSNLTEHVPVPLVIVNIAPEFEQAPALENVTAPPGAVADTEKLEPKTADNGACVVTEIDWSAFCAVTASTT